MLRYIFSLLILTFLSLESSAANLINAGPDFIKATSQWEQLDFQERLAAWVQFEYKYRDAYDFVVYRRDKGGWEARQENLRNGFFYQLPEIREKMITAFRKAPRVVALQEAKFRKVFSDLPQDIPVYLMPSMLTFNGKVSFSYELNRAAVYIGVDAVALRSDNLNVLFSHELFHTYHSTKIKDAEIGKTMATPLWLEGFATYVSGVLNPRQDEQNLLMDEELSSACVKPEFLSDIAGQYLEVLSSDDKSGSQYEDWFLLKGTSEPKRRGYCLGVRVIRELAKSNSMAEMVTWGESRFTDEIKRVLQQFVNQ